LASSARSSPAWLLPQLGIRLGTGIVAAIINSAIGGVIVLVILRH
jgi:uncharacterized membrane protein YeaQ/YmgE (transglycosylase-associated protein family)